MGHCGQQGVAPCLHKSRNVSAAVSASRHRERAVIVAAAYDALMARARAAGGRGQLSHARVRIRSLGGIRARGAPATRRAAAPRRMRCRVAAGTVACEARAPARPPVEPLGESSPALAERTRAAAAATAAVTAAATAAAKVAATAAQAVTAVPEEGARHPSMTGAAAGVAAGAMGSAGAATCAEAARRAAAAVRREALA